MDDKKLFEQKWQDFIEYEKSEYSNCNSIVYVKETKTLCVLTKDKYVTFLNVNEKVGEVFLNAPKDYNIKVIRK